MKLISFIFNFWKVIQLVLLVQSIKLLGKGGFGAVYEVKRMSDSAAFAMKCELMDVKKRVIFSDMI